MKILFLTMGKLFLFKLTLFSLACYGVIMCAASYMSRESHFVLGDNGYTLVGRQILVRRGVSRARCGGLCLKHGRCLSFNYGITSRTCQLNGGTKDQFPGSFQRAAGFSYFDCQYSKSQGKQIITTMAPQLVSSVQQVHKC